MELPEPDNLLPKPPSFFLSSVEVSICNYFMFLSGLSAVFLLRSECESVFY